MDGIRQVDSRFCALRGVGWDHTYVPSGRLQCTLAYFLLREMLVLPLASIAPFRFPFSRSYWCSPSCWRRGASTWWAEYGRLCVRQNMVLGRTCAVYLGHSWTPSMTLRKQACPCPAQVNVTPCWAAPVLLLCAGTLDTDTSCSRWAVDGWLLLRLHDGTGHKVGTNTGHDAKPKAQTRLLGTRWIGLDRATSCC